MIVRLILICFMCSLSSTAQAPRFLRIAEKIKNGLRADDDWTVYFERLRRIREASLRDGILDLVLDEFPLFMGRYQAYLDECNFLDSFPLEDIVSLMEEFMKFSREEQIKILQKISRMSTRFYRQFLKHIPAELEMLALALLDSNDLGSDSENSTVVCASSEYSGLSDECVPLDNF